ncbi:MAG: saccharopine dehydrogenase NADP-binding domain-containing protein [Candidatus Sericytochromatia bacterium]|nr:saccharopine dehydrogenase NADP-binding domain-containing protein [Candidatus Sericytochromatia bacterium]
MGYQYIVLGAGIQGTTIAYDMARFGEAERVRLLDMELNQARQAAEHINQLLQTDCVQAGQLDVSDAEAVTAALKGADSCLSAVPYRFNPMLARCAIAAGVSFNDLGGKTDLVFEALALHEEALAANVSIIPDCGVAPGLGNTLAAYGISQLDTCHSVQIRCGGLPQNPQPPLDYMLVFNIGGLTNEYFGISTVLRNGERLDVPTFSELEHLTLPEPLGECEAFVTSGGTSTCPWTFAGQVQNYDYKTIRYKGHYEKFKVLLDLGLLSLDPVEVNGQQIVPRELFHAVASKALDFPGEKDLLILRVSCSGTKDGQPKTLEYTILDYYDESTGFNAMSRMTGFPASIVAIMSARGQNARGAVALEKAVPGDIFLEELARRGLNLEITEK